MEEPSTSTHNGDLRAESRSSRATTSGFVTTLAGISLSVRAADPSPVDAFRATFDPADAVDLGAQDTEPDTPEIVVVLEAEAREAPVEGEPVETYPDLRVWRDGDLLTLLHDRGVCAQVDDHRVRIGAGADLVAAYRRLLPHALAHVLATHQRFVVHAAAVAAPGESALVLIGSSGAGKSTLAYGALRAGWAVLGDDLVVLSRRGSDVVVDAFPKPLAIPGDALANADADPGADPADPRGRVTLPASVLAAGAHTVAGLVLLERGGGPEIDHVSIPDLLSAVVGSFPGASEPERTRRFLPIAAQLARGPTATLRASPDVRDSPAAAAATLTRLADALQ